MVSGAKPPSPAPTPTAPAESPAYSGRMSPAEGHMRLISAMMVVLLGLVGRTALKKLRGGSSWATMSSRSVSGVCDLALATSSRLCSIIWSRVMFEGAAKRVIVGVALGACGRALAGAAGPAQVGDGPERVARGVG